VRVCIFTGSTQIFVAAYYRKGSALVSLGKYKEALKGFKKVAKAKPKDKDARKKLKACEKLVKQAAFAAAIESDETKPLSETIAVDSMSKFSHSTLWLGSCCSRLALLRSN
jgi:ABC-type Fe3+-citrate transport system substrate-binding protein